MPRDVRLVGLVIILGAMGLVGLLRVVLISAGVLPERPDMARPAPSPALVAEVRRPYEAALAASHRPTAHITLEPLGRDDRFVSKVGGAPYWPEGEPLPRAPNGRHLVLLAQLRLEELPLAAGYPAEGLLQFYIDSADDLYGMSLEEEYDFEDLRRQDGFRVVYWPPPLLDAERLAPVAPPIEPVGPHHVRMPLRMRFRAETEEITPLDADFESVVGVDATQLVSAAAEANGVDEGALADAVFASGDGHKVGGYPYFTQSDPRPSGSPYRLLLQLDTDDVHHIMWGDAGVGGFFIDPEALARADFSDVVYSWDCH